MTVSICPVPSEIATACARVCAPSFVIAFRTCDLIVSGDRTRCCAISPPLGFAAHHHQRRSSSTINMGFRTRSNAACRRAAASDSVSRPLADDVTDAMA
jgi:hypothetical protein